MRALSILVVALSVALLVVSPQALSFQCEASSDPSRSHLTEPLKLNFIWALNATITKVDNRTITIRSDNSTFEAVAAGRWLLVSESEVGLQPWALAKEYIDEGDASALIANVSWRGEEVMVLLCLKQGDVLVIRPLTLKHYTRVHRHGNFEFTCRLVEKMGSSLIVEKRGLKALVLLDPDGLWYRAGYGDVEWRDVVDQLSVSDTLWLCTHNILVLKGELADMLGFNALIWGFSGAIMDLTNGLALAKYPL